MAGDSAICGRLVRFQKLRSPLKDSARTSFRMEPLLERLLRSLGGSEANFLEVCLGRIPYGNFHTKATSKKSRQPSGNFRLNPPELPRSPSRSFSSHEAGWRIQITSKKGRVGPAILKLQRVEARCDLSLRPQARHFFFSHRPPPLKNSALRSKTLQGVDFGSILGRFLGQKD